jgi:hypothetical protein
LGNRKGSLLVRLNTCTKASCLGAETAAFDKPEGPATALLVRTVVAGFSGEPADWLGGLKGVVNVFLAPTLVDVGVRPKPTRRDGAGVLISIAWSVLPRFKVGKVAIGCEREILVVVRSGVLKAVDGSASGVGR